MVDTIRNQDAFTNVSTGLFRDGQATGSITPQVVRDFIVTALGIFTSTQTASYTLALTDSGTCVEVNNASATNVTVPPNSSVAFAVGAVVEIAQYGAGQVTLVAGSGVTLRTSTATLTTRAQYSSVSIRKRATDEWIVSGDLS